MRRARLLLAAVLLIGGCDRLASPGERAVAAGPLRVIGAASTAARRCGVRDTRLDPLDLRRAVLRLGTSHTAQGEACLRAWLTRNRGRLDARLLAQVAAT